MRRMILIVFCTAIQVVTAHAGQISQSAFTAAASTQTFESLGEGGGIAHTTPWQIGNDVYEGDGHLLETSSKFSFNMGRQSGIALGNSPPRAHSATGFIDITLGTPALRAGMYVGFEAPWVAQAEFYNTSNDLLGTLAMNGGARESRFAAWQADAGMIGRIRVVDGTTNDIYRLCIDDVIQEVPEPASAIIVTLGIFLRFTLLRRRLNLFQPRRDF
jgi:hypothetical protein